MAGKVEVKISDDAFAAERRASALELDLRNLAAFTEGRATAALTLLDPSQRYSPRTWLPSHAKRKIQRLLLELVDEARWQAAGGARVKPTAPPIDPSNR